MKEKGSPVYQLFLLVLSIYVLGVVCVDLFVVKDPEIKLVLQYIDFAVCLVFLADFFVNLLSAESKRRYLKWGWIDLVASIPALDPLRWGRLSRVVRILRFIRTIKSLRVLYQSLQESKFQSFTFFVLLVTFLAYTLGASLILEFERDSGGTINTAPEALWWAFLNIMNAKVSISQAVTASGMAVTVVLNKVGLLLFAYFNAILIAWLLQKRIDYRRKVSVSDDGMPPADSFSCDTRLKTQQVNP